MGESNLNFFQASEAHMVTYINHLRFAVFDNFIKNNPNATKEERMAYAEFTNNISGTTNKWQPGKWTNAAFLAFKYMVSRFKTLNELVSPTTYYKAFVEGDKVSKQMVLDLWSSVATIVISMAVLAFFWGDDAYIDMEPYSNEFLKLVIGDNSIDFTAGVGAIIRATMQTIGMFAMKIDPESVSEIDRASLEDTNEKFGFLGAPAAPFLKFITQKANPVFSVGKNLWDQKSFIGEPYKPLGMQVFPSIQQASEFAPIFPRNLVETWGADDSPSILERVSQTAFGLVGGSYSNFQSQISEARLKRLLRETDVSLNKKLRLPEKNELNAHPYFKWLWRDEVKRAIGTELMLKLTRGAKLKKSDVDDIIEKYKVSGEKGGEIVANVTKKLKALNRQEYVEIVKTWQSEEQKKKEKKGD